MNRFQQILLGLCVATVMALVYVTFTRHAAVVTETDTVQVKVVSPACAQALVEARKMVTANAHLTEVTNRLAPIVDDVYAAGLEGQPAAPLAQRVKRWNVAVRKAHAEAGRIPPRFDRLATRCYAARQR